VVVVEEEEFETEEKQLRVRRSKERSKDREMENLSERDGEIADKREGVSELTLNYLGPIPARGVY
jgi:hypothetical protein